MNGRSLKKTGSSLGWFQLGLKVEDLPDNSEGRAEPTLSHDPQLPWDDTTGPWTKSSSLPVVANKVLLEQLHSVATVPLSLAALVQQAELRS